MFERLLHSEPLLRIRVNQTFNQILGLRTQSLIIRVTLVEFTIFDSLVENIHPESEIETTVSQKIKLREINLLKVHLLVYFLERWLAH